MTAPRSSPSPAAPDGRDARRDVADVGELAFSAHLQRVATAAAHGVRDYLRDAFADVQDVSLKKNFQDLVTRHDREAEEMLSSALLAAIPDSGVLGEEGGRTGDGAVEWIVDPIDGTSNFAMGVPHFAVSIGAALDGRMLAGVIFEPLRDVTYAASLAGASRNGVPMRSRGAVRDREALLLTSFPGPDLLRDDEAAGQSLATYRQLVRSFASMRRLGCTTLSLCLVAEGAAAAAYGFGINPWDVAAGYLIVEQAGGSYLPLGAESAAKAPWLAPGYLATVADYDLASSALSALL
ncbi:inositol monophosphatase family protein [Microlunatus panaciterrae]|uniref:inositol-phosphate phosphatase n=1 Tax=Microlunatus panaciterrae TaxID=400768 RepID=A0ABS2RLY4_9ACTN|nr:inositol monophosphatase family protein [Microlunatus panaciterrae]MBM7800021.1 myo-inositol-1(or 4)-monophosphatase [Microlunatus panaciterrae]